MPADRHETRPFKDGTQYPSQGERVVVRRLGSTEGFLIHPRPMACRKVGAVGTATSYVPGHGGDVWFVQHDDGSVGAYCYDELESLDATPTAPDSHEPAGRVDVPGAAPEWAVEMAQKLNVDFSQEVVNICNRSESLTVGSGGVWEKMLARLLATLRERTLREAADKAMSLGGSAYPSDCQDAILSLIAQPPKDEA